MGRRKATTLTPFYDQPTAQFLMRLTPKQYMAFKGIAELAGQSMAQYALRAIKERFERDHPNLGDAWDYSYD